jgi:hypothetical protein
VKDREMERTNGAITQGKSLRERGGELFGFQGSLIATTRHGGSQLPKL